MKSLKSFLSVVFISLLAISCGSGGGGDDSGSGGSGGSSGGGTTGNGQVSQQSMDEFVLFLTDNLSGCTSQSVSTSVKAINISSMLSSSKDMYDNYQSIPAPARAIANALNLPSDLGICDSGSASLSTPTDTDQILIGNINFSGCTIGAGVDAIFINGPLSFTLQGNDLSQLDLSSISASSGGITINTGSESISTQLSISATFTTSATGDLTGLNATITNLSISDNNSSEQFSLTNTNIQATGLDTDVVQINSSGTYNDSELGTFTFNTPGGLTIDTTTGSETVTGSVQVDGSNGSDILLTINDNDDIIFQADADGDGSTDFSDTVNCSGLTVPTLPSI